MKISLFNPLKSLIFTLSLAYALSLLSAGCAKSTDTLPVSPQSGHGDATGTILSNIKKLHESPDREACDLNPETMRKQIELAQAIDDHQALIDANAGTAPLDPARWKRSPLGPIHLIESTADSLPLALDKWSEDYDSWDQIYTYYKDKMKDAPTVDQWLTLNRWVRGYIPDDEDRLDGVNVFNDKDSGPLILDALTQVSACVKDPACTKLNFEAKTAAFLHENPIYQYYVNTLDKLSDPAKMRDGFVKFEKRLTYDYKRYHFRFNASVRRASATELVLPLYAGDFANYPEALVKLASVLETEWNSPTLSLKIEWQKTRDALTDLFQFLIEPGIGGRSYVLGSDHTVHLFAEIKATVVSHEIGHVLGFRDHYYTVWHPESCSYATQILETDIMSDSNKGKVTTSEWATLNEKYALPSAQITPQITTAVEPVTPDAKL